MITIETKDGNVEVDEKDILLITSGIPAAFASIVMCKRGKDILSKSPVLSIKSALENRQEIYLKDVSTPYGTTFLVQTNPFSQLEKEITPEEIVPRGTMDS